MEKMEIIEDINTNLQLLKNVNEDKTKIFHQIEKILGHIEYHTRFEHHKNSARLAASLRDICRLHYPNELTEKQLKIFSTSINALIEKWDGLTKKEVGQIRTKLLDCGLTWIPVTEKAITEIKMIYPIVILLLLLSMSFAALTPINESQVISSKTSKIFHKFDCRYASSLTTLNANIFDTYEIAIEAELRPCKTCKPQPSEIIPVDPNIINIIPSRESTSFFPINGVVIQSEYCKRDFEPNDIGVRIIEPIITALTLQNKTTLLSCSKCAKWNFFTGEGDVPQEYIIPIYEPDPYDPNSTIIAYYKIDSSMPIYKSNQSIYYHLDKDCEYAKSVPVYIVNLRNGLAAGSNGYWNPIEGIIEWRITPFEAGDYVAVINTEVGQTQLLAITVRAKRIPTLKEFTERWLKGNFNLLKYSEWIENKEMWEKYLATVGNLSDRNIIEWVFEDGKWKPVTSGYNPISVIDADTNITEKKIKDRQTTTKEIRIAPYEWRAQEVKVVTTEVTTFDGYPIHQDKPIGASIKYLMEPPYTSKDKSLILTSQIPTPEQMAAYYVEIDISPPPEKVSLPQSFDEMMVIANNIKNFKDFEDIEDLPEKFKIETYSKIIDEYIIMKNKYEKYLQEKQVWEEEFKIKQEDWQAKSIETNMREMDVEMERMHDLEMHEIKVEDIANNLAQCYTSTINELTEEEKDLLLSIRRKIISGKLNIEPLKWDEIEVMMDKIDSQDNEPK